MRLTGIQIVVGGRTKFVGKVGVCPRNSTVPELAGRIILYRDPRFWEQATSVEGTMIGVDAEAWDKAKELGAVACVTFVRDVKRCVWADAATMDGGTKTELGEGAQMRVPLMRCRVIENASPVNIGYTTYTVTVGDGDETPTPQVLAERRQAEVKKTFGKAVELKGGYATLAQTINRRSYEAQRKNGVRESNLVTPVTPERGEYFMREFSSLPTFYKTLLARAYGIGTPIMSPQMIAEKMAEESSSFRELVKKKKSHRKAFDGILNEALKALLKQVEL